MRLQLVSMRALSTTHVAELMLWMALVARVSAQCPAGQGSASGDGQDCADCAPGTFSPHDDNSACAVHSLCDAWSYISIAGTASADVVCEDHSRASCPEGMEPKPSVLAGTETADCMDEAGCCQTVSETCGVNEHVEDHACIPCDLTGTRPAGDDAAGPNTECFATCATVSHADCGPGYLAARGECACLQYLDPMITSGLCYVHPFDDDEVYGYCSMMGDQCASVHSIQVEGCGYEGAVLPANIWSPDYLPHSTNLTLAATCAGPVCDVANVAADRAACCIPLATCGDIDGAGPGTASASDVDCGLGFRYDATQSGAFCAGAACDVSGSGGDHATCCVPKSDACPNDCCQSDARANKMKAWWCVKHGICY